MHPNTIFFSRNTRKKMFECQPALSEPSRITMSASAHQSLIHNAMWLFFTKLSLALCNSLRNNCLGGQTDLCKCFTFS